MFRVVVITENYFSSLENLVVSKFFITQNVSGILKLK